VAMMVGLPAPGTVNGPCEKPCKDCAATRSDAETECVECCKPLGYDVPFYYCGGGEVIHGACQAVVSARVRARRS
jgi:hypothetical protein